MSIKLKYNESFVMQHSYSDMRPRLKGAAIYVRENNDGLLKI